MTDKADYLRDPLEELDVSRYNVVPLLRAMHQTGLAARDLALAADLYDEMLCDPDCGIVLCLEEAADDRALGRLGIRCVGGALVDEEQLRACQETIEKIAGAMPPGPCSSRELVRRLGAHLDARQSKPTDSIVYEAHRLGVPIFCPGLEHSATGLGAVAGRVAAAGDFQELARLTAETRHMGLVAIGDPPGDFSDSLGAAAEALGARPTWEYAVAIATPEGRDGPPAAENPLAGLDAARSQLLCAQPTLAAPLLITYAYHLAHWLGRPNRHFDRLLSGEPEGGAGGEPGD